MAGIPWSRIAATALAVSVASTALHAQTAPVPLSVQADQPGPVISRDIFGQFAEHLGQGIYGGVWVGPTSKIPNVRGIRSDVTAALKAIKVPVVRWPGGCFADKYNWRAGVGPAAKRPVTLNSTWGGATEPNSFGTNEFMDFAEQIGAEAYLSVNVGSGTPEQAADWFEYITTDQPTTLGKERAANGHPAPFKIKYMGIGNEMWGCGGNMTATAYVDRMKQWLMHVDSRHPDQVDLGLLRRAPQGLRRIAVGDGGESNDYFDAVMQAWKTRQPWYWNIEGVSMHHYNFGEAMLKARATGFGEKEYAGFLKEALDMDRVITARSAVMDKYDPRKQVALVVDEWGSWLAPLPGLNPMFLKQQNSLRDGIAAALNLNIFARHADRVRMTNIAQMVNVLQAMILTDGPKMVLTPTYHVYKMYVPFQDAQFLPVTFKSAAYTFDTITLPQVDAIAAKAKDGKVWLALTNLDPNHSADVDAGVQGVAATRAVGEVLNAATFDAFNSFDAPAVVTPKPVSVQASGGKLILRLPPHSVTVVQLMP